MNVEFYKKKYKIIKITWRTSFIPHLKLESFTTILRPPCKYIFLTQQSHAFWKTTQSCKNLKAKLSYIQTKINMIISRNINLIYNKTIFKTKFNKFQPLASECNISFLFTNLLNSPFYISILRKFSMQVAIFEWRNGSKDCKILDNLQCEH